MTAGYRVTVTHESTLDALPWTYTVRGDGVTHMGRCEHRDAAYACALAALRGLLKQRDHRRKSFMDWLGKALGAGL